MTSITTFVVLFSRQTLRPPVEARGLTDKRPSFGPPTLALKKLNLGKGLGGQPLPSLQPTETVFKRAMTAIVNEKTRTSRVNAFDVNYDRPFKECSSCYFRFF